MHFIFYLVTLALVGYYLQTRQLPTRRAVLVYFMLLGAVSAFAAGFFMAVSEDALGRYGRVVAGTVRERFSTSGEQGTRTIGFTLRPNIRTSTDNQFYDLLARVMATGSTDMWAVDYSYPCEPRRTCWQRSVVPRHRWLQMRPGQAVNVRYVDGAFAGARLEEQPLWPAAIARMAIGVVLAALAALLWGPAAASQHARAVATLAVVTDVEPVPYRGGSRWRVRFSFLDREGTSHEASDEFATPAWKPGDTGVAMYEPGNPKAAGLAATRNQIPVG